MGEICCYILYSQKLRKFYTGICQERLETRIKKHNKQYYSYKNFTSRTDDWVLYLRIDTKDFGHARRLELKIKKMKSSTYIRNLKKYPELISKILDETKST